MVKQIWHCYTTASLLNSHRIAASKLMQLETGTTDFGSECCDGRQAARIWGLILTHNMFSAAALGNKGIVSKHTT